MSDGSLGRAGSGWIDPYSDAYSSTLSQSKHIHTHTGSMTRSPIDLMSVEKHAIVDSVQDPVHFRCFVVYINVCFIVFFSINLLELETTRVWMQTKT